MTRKTLNLTDKLYDYLLAVSLREPDILSGLRKKTATMPMARMQIAPEQGQFMALLIKLINARYILEIGTFTGYSTLWMAQALPEDGKIITCDIDVTSTDIAREYWEKAGVDQKIQLILAPAQQTMDVLITDGWSNKFDFVFIDAEKKEYIEYYERILPLLRTGGLICIDNVLWSGKPAEDDNDEDTIAIREFNRYLYKDNRIELSLLPVADGVSLAVKR